MSNFKDMKVDTHLLEKRIEEIHYLLHDEENRDPEEALALIERMESYGIEPYGLQSMRDAAEQQIEDDKQDILDNDAVDEAREN